MADIPSHLWICPGGAGAGDAWCWRAEAKGGGHAGDGHRTAFEAQGAAEYDLIWLLQQRLHAVSIGLTGACAACSHCWAAAWELLGLDHSHAATPQRVTRASCAQLLRSVLGAACR